VISSGNLNNWRVELTALPVSSLPSAPGVNLERALDESVTKFRSRRID
jgi:hypothetical protein